MADVSWLVVALAFLVGMGVLFIIATAIKNWVFELSPREWGVTIVLAADLGAFGVAYLDGNGLIEVLSGGLLALAVLWWVVRLFWRHRARQMQEDE